MFKVNATLSEDEFEECLKEAHEGMTVSDWTPWEDTTEALEAISAAVAMGAPTMELTAAAWASYRAHQQ